MNDYYLKYPIATTPDEYIDQAQYVLNKNPLFMDSATSALDCDDHEIIEIAIADKDGNILFESLVKPRIKINRIYLPFKGGLRDEDLVDGPVWEDIHDEVSSILKGRTVAIYNADFELSMLRQTTKIHNRTLPVFKAYCVMGLYANLFTGYRMKLTTAAEKLGVQEPPRGQPYRAAYDCLLCVGVMNAIANFDKTALPELLT